MCQSRKIYKIGPVDRFVLFDLVGYYVEFSPQIHLTVMSPEALLPYTTNLNVPLKPNKFICQTHIIYYH
jgi:hypothetical protein